MYKEASKITNNQIFVVIVEQANYGWISYCYKEGIETLYYNNEKFNFFTNLH
jgi:hypothetical protein